MRKHSLPFIITSNVFLFFPIVASLYAQEWIYSIFSFFLLIASVGFHYTHYYNQKSFSLTRFLFGGKKYKNEKTFRLLDWSLAAIGALYVFYFIYVSPAVYILKLTSALLFFASFVFFLLNYKVGNYKKYHPWFHVFTQTLLGFIVLFL